MEKSKLKPHPAILLALDLETEESFKSWAIDLFQTYHYKVAHFRGAWSKNGERFITPVEADGEGFPDLLATKGEVTIYAELKSMRGKVSPKQQEWLEILAENPGNQCYIWRPCDRDKIMEVAKNGK
jgi:hypothetical protein